MLYFRSGSKEVKFFLAFVYPFKYSIFQLSNGTKLISNDMLHLVYDSVKRVVTYKICRKKRNIRGKKRSF